MKLRTEDVRFHSASMIDSAGRLFSWNGSIYRAISPDRTQFYTDLLERKQIQELFNHGLVETKASSLSLDGYGLVLEHRLIPFVSYCMEWTASMLKDAALLVCDLSAALCNKGLTFKDAHPWNILFDRGKPVFVDWGSIDAKTDRTHWPFSQFRDRFIFPLYLLSSGKSSFTRDLMLDVLHCPSSRDVLKLLFGTLPLPDWYKCWSQNRSFDRDSVRVDASYFQRLRNFVNSIPLSPEPTEWSNYEGPDGTIPRNVSDDWPSKISGVHSLLQRLKPTTVMDIGCNRGWFSEMAAEEGARVIAVDIDESNVSRLYQKVKQSGASILPVFMDFCTPTPSHGVTGGYPDAGERFQSELVLALAITHHLIFKRALTFHAVAKQLALFSKKWLLVEFVPPEDKYVSEWMNEQFRWYNLDGFKDALGQFFSRIEVMESTPSPRLLLFCEKSG